MLFVFQSHLSTLVAILFTVELGPNFVTFLSLKLIHIFDD